MSHANSYHKDFLKNFVDFFALTQSFIFYVEKIIEENNNFIIIKIEEKPQIKTFFGFLLIKYF